MILLISGSRKFFHRSTIHDGIKKVVAAVGDIDLAVHGDAPGVDTVADSVLEELGIQRLKVPANWTKHKKAAGPIRNSLMLDLVQAIDKRYVLLAFPTASSIGTRDMIKKCEDPRRRAERAFIYEVRSNSK